MKRGNPLYIGLTLTVNQICAYLIKVKLNHLNLNHYNNNPNIQYYLLTCGDRRNESSLFYATTIHFLNVPNLLLMSQKFLQLSSDIIVWCTWSKLCLCDFVYCPYLLVASTPHSFLFLFKALVAEGNFCLFPNWLLLECTVNWCYKNMQNKPIVLICEARSKV